MHNTEKLVRGRRVVISNFTHKNYTGTIIGTRKLLYTLYTVQLDQAKLGSQICNFRAKHLTPIPIKLEVEVF